MFITLEGIEGSGKTTQLEHIVDYLKGRGCECTVTREPGGTRIGKKIRSILLDPDSREIDPMTELLLYMADRSQHINEIIIPHLASGKLVLCDRYYDATLVYQGYARGIDIEIIQRLHRWVLKDLKPDVTILMDLEPQIGLKRAWKEIDRGTRTGRETRFEKETLRFHKKVRAGYLALARNDPDRFEVIDASQSERQVRERIIHLLDRKIAA